MCMVWSEIWKWREYQQLSININPLTSGCVKAWKPDLEKILTSDKVLFLLTKWLTYTKCIVIITES